MTDEMPYRRCGRSGLLLPEISLGLWQNFGEDVAHETKAQICRRAFDLGIAHFDLANNYGPPRGSAEKAFGQILAEDFRQHRDEMVISSKAGYGMWGGPYGEWGSRKYMIASLGQSLKRLGLDYVDIFYSHRFDPDTPLEETMGALDHAVRMGKALYVGISNYDAANVRKAAAILRDLGTPCLIHQPRYSMLDRKIETGGILEAAADEGMGTIVFSPLAQGLLTSRYLDGIPEGSRATHSIFLKPDAITPELRAKLKNLDAIAKQRGQSLAQMALAWVLRDKRMTSALIGVSRVSQLEECAKAVEAPPFESDELASIEKALKT